jgi:hypothetical protein
MKYAVDTCTAYTTRNSEPDLPKVEDKKKTKKIEGA